MAPVMKYVTADEIRRVFNENRYFERFQEGEFFGYVEPPEPGSSPDASQTVRYVMAHNHGRTVAVVNQRAGDKYGNPLGDDRPDPKRLVHQGIDYRYSPKAKPEPGES